MKPYKGIIRISCQAGACKQRFGEPEAGCINCADGLVEILDFEDKVIAAQEAAGRKAQGPRSKAKGPSRPQGRLVKKQKATARKMAQGQRP